MKQGSKNRLTPQQADLFAPDTLFGRIARAVCRAGTLPRKELYEAWETAKRVRRRYRGGRVLDLACGHGLLAHMMLILDDSSPEAWAVDRHIPKSAAALSRILTEAWPRIKGRVHFKKADMDTIEVTASDLVVSVHACGALTDLVLEKAVNKRARVAVLPCCHNSKISSMEGLDSWMDKALAIDTVRAMRLKQAGYAIHLCEIPDTVTPKNRLLMGAPL
jgi:SAM-dependent methyltransferase